LHKKHDKEGLIVSVRPEMAPFGSEQGLSNFETAGIVRYSEDLERAKTPLWARVVHVTLDKSLF